MNRIVAGPASRRTAPGRRAGQCRRGSRHPSHAGRNATDDLQLRRHHHGPRTSPADRQGRRQPHPVRLGQHAHRPHLDRVPHPRPARQGRPGRYHLPRRPQRCLAMEHQEPDCRQDPRRDPLLHQRHHLGGRLRGHRQRRRNEAGHYRLRAGLQQLGRTLRQRPDAAGGGQDQPGREDRRAGPSPAAGPARAARPAGPRGLRR